MKKNSHWHADSNARHEFSRLFNNSLDILGVGNLRGYFLQINPTFTDILGFSQKELCEVPFLEFIHPADVAKTAEALADAAGGQRKIFIENRYRCKDGSYKWIEWRVYADAAEDRFAAVGRDISARKELEERLEEKQSMLKAITTTATDSIFCKDINRRYTFVNEAMKNLLGCVEADLLGKTPEEVFGPEEGVTVREVDDMTFSGQKVSDIRQLYLNGEQHFFHTVQVPMQSKNGKVINISGIVRDVTEQVQMLEELKEHRNNLETLVSERTRELEQKTKNLAEANIALKVLLEQREQSQKEIEISFIKKVDKLVMPYLEKITTTKSPAEIKTLAEIIESHLKDIISPFALKFRNVFSKLTPNENKVADLVRIGKTTKEIAKLLNLSPATIATHRQNIRKKLDLTNKKSNLQSTLIQQK